MLDARVQDCRLSSGVYRPFEYSTLIGRQIKDFLPKDIRDWPSWVRKQPDISGVLRITGLKWIWLKEKGRLD